MAELGIVAFIEARLAEDEAAAHDGESACWHVDYCDDNGEPFHERFTPARALAEIEAKRRRLDLHRPDPNAWTPRCMTCLSDRAGRLSDDWEPDEWPCETILLDAAPYAEHADFATAWRLP